MEALDELMCYGELKKSGSHCEPLYRSMKESNPLKLDTLPWQPWAIGKQQSQIWTHIKFRLWEFCIATKRIARFGNYDWCKMLLPNISNHLIVPSYTPYKIVYSYGVHPLIRVN